VTTHLLDANVLIALTVEEHEHHARVMTWIRDVTRVAVCPVVEGSLIRFLLRIGESAGVASEVVRQMRGNPRCEFWPDSVSYADADLSGVHGHRQVTDAYLVALAASRPDARLATLDRALAQLRPDLTVLVDRG
jgi:toxin-antitoxin system PIN domain toxin